MTFEDLDAWKRSRQMVKSIYTLTRQTPLARDYGLVGQLQRAGVSVMSNIAEGFERMHPQEKLQFYNVAHASTAEVRSLLYVIEDNFATSAPAATALRQEAAEVGKLVGGLMRSTAQRQPGRKFIGDLLALLGVGIA